MAGKKTAAVDGLKEKYAEAKRLLLGTPDIDGTDFTYETGAGTKYILPLGVTLREINELTGTVGASELDDAESLKAIFSIFNPQMADKLDDEPVVMCGDMLKHYMDAIKGVQLAELGE